MSKSISSFVFAVTALSAFCFLTIYSSLAQEQTVAGTLRSASNQMYSHGFSESANAGAHP